MNKMDYKAILNYNDCKKISLLWSDYLDKYISPKDVINMLILFNIVKNKEEKIDKDDYMNIMNYSKCGMKICDKESQEKLEMIQKNIQRKSEFKVGDTVKLKEGKTYCYDLNFFGTRKIDYISPHNWCTVIGSTAKYLLSDLMKVNSKPKFKVGDTVGLYSSAYKKYKKYFFDDNKKIDFIDPNGWCTVEGMTENYDLEDLYKVN